MPTLKEWSPDQEPARHFEPISVPPSELLAKPKRPKLRPTTTTKGCNCGPTKPAD